MDSVIKYYVCGFYILRYKVFGYSVVGCVGLVDVSSRLFRGLRYLRSGVLCYVSFDAYTMQ